MQGGAFVRKNASILQWNLLRRERLSGVFGFFDAGLGHFTNYFFVFIAELTLLLYSFRRRHKLLGLDFLFIFLPFECCFSVFVIF